MGSRPGIARAWVRALVALIIAWLVFPVSPAAVVAAPPAPVLQTPADGAHVAGTPAFGWSPTGGAVRYAVEIAGPAGFDTPLVDRTTVNRWLTTTEALPAGPLSWRVAAIDAGGARGPWATGSFTIDGGLGAPVLDPQVVQAPWPASPRLLAWAPVPGAGSYEVRLARDATSLAAAQPFTVYGSRFVLQPVYDADGQLQDIEFWQVRARGIGDLAAGPWSDVGELRSSWAASPVPVTVDGAVLTDRLVLDWERQPGATSYEVALEPLDGQGDPATINASGSRAAVPWNQWPARYGDVRWRVRGVSRMTTFEDPFHSAWSAWRTVTVVRAEAPAPLQPPNGATVPGQPRLAWTPVPRKTTYRLELSTDPSFGAGTTVTTFLDDTVVEAGTPLGTGGFGGLGLRDGATYWWRVRAEHHQGVGGTTGWSTVRSFTVDAPPIDLHGPADGATVEIPTLTWDVSGGLGFEVVIRDATDSVVATGLTSAGRWTPPERLDPADGPFTWRVRAVTLNDHDLVTASSPVRSFSLGALAATATEAVIADPPDEPWFSLGWTPVAGADHYAIFREWAPGADPENPMADDLAYPAFTHAGPWLAGHDPTPPDGASWRVIAYAANGSEVSRGPAKRITLPAPAAPVVTGPAACATAGCGTPTSPTFTWQPVANALIYSVSISASGQVQMGSSGPTSGTAYRMPVVGSNTRSLLEWRVTACSAVTCSAPSPVRPYWWSRVVPEIVGPAQGAVVEDEATTGIAGGTPPAAPPDQEPAWTYQDPAYVRDDVWYVAGDTPQEVTWGYEPYLGGARRTFTLQASPTGLVAPAAGTVTDGTPLLRWTPLSGNVAYVVEIHRGGEEPLGMDTVVLREVAHDASYAPSRPLPPGDYRWRVQRGRYNPSGYETAGLPWSATGTFTVAGGAPTSLIAPDDGETRTPADLLLEWAGVEGAAGYRVELSRDAAFAVLGYASTTAAPAWAPGAPLSGGTWYWRVAVLGPGETPLSTSAARSLVVDAPLLKPLRNAVVIDGGAALTTGHEVEVTLPIAAASGNRRVRLSNDGVTWRTYPTPWYSQPFHWDLSPAAVDGPNGETTATPGPYTVYGQWEDPDGTWSEVATDTIVLDAHRPVASPTLDGGATETADAEVLLDPGVADDDAGGPSLVCNSGDDPGPCRWLPGNSGPVPWLLGDPDGAPGPRTVCVQPYDVAHRFNAGGCVSIDYLGTADPATPAGHVALAMDGGGLPPSHWRAGEAIELTPVFGTGRTPPSTAVCTWELRWGDHAALRDGAINGTGGGVMTSGTAAEGFCDGWRFTLPDVTSHMATVSFTARDSAGTLLAATPAAWEHRPRFGIVPASASPEITASSLPIVTLGVEGGEEPGDALVFSATARGFSPTTARLTGTSPAGATVTSPSATSLQVTAPEKGRWSVRWTGTRGVANVAAYLDPTSTMLDTVAPRSTAPSARPRDGASVGATVPVRVAWAGSDAGSGIARYEVRRSRNGGGWTVVATASPGSTSVTVSLDRSDTYRFRVRAIDRAGNPGPWMQGPTIRPTLVAESLATRRGTWSRRVQATALGGSFLRSTAPGASVTYRFTGRAVGWIAPTGPGRGRADVYVDGARVSTVDLRAASEHPRRIVFSRSWASAGTHTIRVVVRAMSVRRPVDVDGFVVLR